MATCSSQEINTVAWKKCLVCKDQQFKNPREFCGHLRDFHRSKEGDSFICRYDVNGFCSTLPVEGSDYDNHITRMHAAGTTKPVSSGGACAAAGQPSVGKEQSKWTVSMSNVNLPAALNNPARRPLDIFSRTWGVAFEQAEVMPSCHLPIITRQHFRRYLKKVGSRLKDHRPALKQAASTEEGSNEISAEAFPALHARKQAERARVELEVIPKIYMLPNFSLENVDTFNTVFPWTQIDNNQHNQMGNPSSKLLQEKLSHYLDLVEVQIARQISLRSEAFFHAMTSHDKLQEDMSQTCSAIKHLRGQMRLLSEQRVECPLKLFHHTRRRANHVKLYNKLKLMSDVHQTQPTIQLLLSTNDFVGALDLISTTQEVLNQELVGIQCFRHLGSQLAEMEKLIDRMMQDDFARYAAADLTRPLSSVELVHNQEKLVAIVLGMVRQRSYAFIDAYREEACTALKTLLKQTVIEAVAAADDIDTEGPVGSLADQMRLLSYAQWMALLKAVFDTQLLMLQRIQGVLSVMLDVVADAAGCSRTDVRQQHHNDVTNTSKHSTQHQNDVTNTQEHPSHHQNSSERVSNPAMCNGISSSASSSEAASVVCSNGESLPIDTTQHLPVRNEAEVMITVEDYEKVSKNLRESLCSVCENAHDRCVKLMTARAKDGFMEKLSSSEFVNLSRSTENFVKKSELICGRTVTSLRGCLQSQANKFITRFHEERKTKLSLIIDNERWKQSDVPAEFQDLVDHVIHTDVLSLPEKKSDADLKKPQEVLHVNGQRYAVVGTVLMLLKMVIEYCQCADDIPSVAPDILTRCIELLKMFNSRTCQLILGAGALQLVGLRTITTKNLALSSRCLQLALHFLPRVREHFETRLHNKQTNMLKHFEHVCKDYNDHIAEIANKLVSIMETMLDQQLSNWEVKPPMPSSSMRAICKQMLKLHDAIVDLLPPEQVLDLFDRTHTSFKVALRGTLIRLGVTNDAGPQHGLVKTDFGFYLGYLKSLPGLEALATANMDDVWDRR